jgi:hypothetical protein
MGVPIGDINPGNLIAAPAALIEANFPFTKRALTVEKNR